LLPRLKNDRPICLLGRLFCLELCRFCLLCGCLSLGPPSDWPIAPLLQECGAWETVPALVTLRMTTVLTLNDSTHSVIARLLNVHRLTVRNYLKTRRLQKPAP